jgi:hypothetical protein
MRFKVWDIISLEKHATPFVYMHCTTFVPSRVKEGAAFLFKSESTVRQLAEYKYRYPCTVHIVNGERTKP